MFKIKLSILLLSSIIIFSCSKIQPTNKIKLSVGYIDGEYDGLLLTNQLKNYLNNLGMLDMRSIYQIQASVSHTSSLYITNIDNTSDREKITSNVIIKIYNDDLKCFTYTVENNISQFYILASSDKFISNKSAEEKIKSENTDYFIKTFINSISEDSFACNEKK